ncbi:hypothetical protein AB3N58_13130 [Leptospira sp. WS60.C2]
MKQVFVFQFICYLLLGISIGCKPSYTKQLDQLIENGTVFQSATFCEINRLHLQERQQECEAVTKQAKEEIDAIINRKLDMGITPVIVEKSKGEEIERFLKVHTQMGIRYWEIWKSNVILE